MSMCRRRAVWILNLCVRNAAAALQRLAQIENVTIAFRSKQAFPPILGERDELIQLFQNLMHNAIKYGRVGGHVWVSSRSNGPYVQAMVSRLP